MAEPSSAGPVEAPTTDDAVARSIRFAVYLTGGLVTLAFGVIELGGVLGEVLNCLLQTQYGCPQGFTQAIYVEYVPALGGAVFLLVTAAVLLFLAHRHR